MRAPRLNRQLVLEHPARVSDGSGGFAVNWLPLGSVWAQVNARSGRETSATGSPVSSVSYRIVLRSAPHGSPDRPKPEQRFRDGLRFFYIQAVVEDDLSGRYLTCFATEEAGV